MFIPTLADKAALKLFYINSNVIDFSPYNTFATIIQKFYKLYIIRVRACIYIQKFYRGYSWREVIFDFRRTNWEYVSRIVEKLRPEWYTRGRFLLERRDASIPSFEHLFTDKVIQWKKWFKFYDNWDTAFSHHLRPILSRRRMNYHASMYHTRIAFRFHN